MSDRVAVVTGANAGLGFQTAMELARSGFTVVLGCRSPARAAQAESRLHHHVPDARTLVIPLDVSEPDSVSEFARQLAGQVGHLDLLINNAGVAGVPLAHNSAGHELQLATNYLGAFALTGKLLPMFRTAAPARIINVGSLAHRIAKLDIDDLNWERSPYGEWRAYARSKIALLTFTMELNRRLRQAGSHVIALAAHPGFASTNIGKSNSLTNPSNPIGKWVNHRMEKLIPSAWQATGPIIFAALAEGVQGGDYYGPGGWLEIAGKPARASLKAVVRNVEKARRLWSLSESLTGIRYLSDL